MTVEASDLEEFIKTKSDFAFELKVLQQFREMGFKCDHSGTYTDPVTNKHRQFDIRAQRTLYTDSFANNINLSLAVECKNISDSAPLLAHCVRRNKSECVHGEIYSHFMTAGEQKISTNDIRIEWCRNDRAIYGSEGGMFVCKSLPQVRKEKEKSKNTNISYSIIGNDSEIYEKWGQAINSCYDLVRQQGEKHAQNILNWRSVVLPVVVVPDDMLWQVVFAEDGTFKLPINRITRISFYLGKEISPWINTEDCLYKDQPYPISHLEIITISGLDDFLKNLYYSLVKDRDYKFS